MCLPWSLQPEYNLFGLSTSYLWFTQILVEKLLIKCHVKADQEQLPKLVLVNRLETPQNNATSSGQKPNWTQYAEPATLPVLKSRLNCLLWLQSPRTSGCSSCQERNGIRRSYRFGIIANILPCRAANFNCSWRSVNICRSGFLCQEFSYPCSFQRLRPFGSSNFTGILKSIFLSRTFFVCLSWTFFMLSAYRKFIKSIM